jgi:multimeric flavodoxin WrbA
MKKVTAFIGTPRKQATYQAVQEFEKNLKSLAKVEIDFEYVFLSDYILKNCIGCKQCIDKGEEFCPLKDDRDVLLMKMEQSDGVIFATPNYAFQVTALMKNFLDRMSFIFHRPRFFGKVFIAIVKQGIFGGASIIKYLALVGGGLGFRVTKGCYLTALEPKTVFEQKKMIRNIKKASGRFYKELMRPMPVSPSFFKLIFFRISRTMMKKTLNENYRDYRYFEEKGWFKSDYYYDVSLGFIQKMAGWFFDLLGKRMAGPRDYDSSNLTQ